MGWGTIKMAENTENNRVDARMGVSSTGWGIGRENGVQLGCFCKFGSFEN